MVLITCIEAILVLYTMIRKLIYIYMKEEIMIA
jgi:hypothetical protein